MYILWQNMNLEWILPSCFVSEYRKKRYFKFMTKHEFKIFLSIMSCFRIPQKKTFWIYVLWQSMNLNSVFSSWAILEYQKILLASWTCGRLENEFRSFNAENLGSIGQRAAKLPAFKVEVSRKSLPLSPGPTWTSWPDSR